MLKRSEAPSKSPDLVGEDVTGNDYPLNVGDNLVIKKIQRRKLESEKAIPHGLVACFVEIEPIRSTAALITSSRDEKKHYLLKEVEIPTSHFFSPKSVEYGEVVGGGFSQNVLHALTSKLLTTLSSRAEISLDEVDFISAYSDTFVGLKNLEESSVMIRNVLESCGRELRRGISSMRLGVPRVCANEIKSKLVAIGSREMTKSEKIFNSLPDTFLDFSTYLSGISISKEDPYAVTGLMTGFGSSVLNALARGHRDVNSERGTTNEIPKNDGEVYEDESKDLSSLATDLMRIRRVPSGKNNVGGVPIDVEESYRCNVKLLGCDIRDGGDNLGRLTEIGRKAASYGSATLQKTIDETFAKIAGKAIKSMYEEELIDSDTKLCISARKLPSPRKTVLTNNHLNEMGFGELAENIAYIENPASFGISQEEFDRYKF